MPATYRIKAESVVDCLASMCCQDPNEDYDYDQANRLIASLQAKCPEDSEPFIDLPASFQVCPRCHGDGQIDGAAIPSGGIGQAEREQMMYDGDWYDFIEDYQAGHYSVPCSECHGKRVTAVVDESRLTVEQRMVWEAEQEMIRGQLECEAEMAAERRAGA